MTGLRLPMSEIERARVLMERVAPDPRPGQRADADEQQARVLARILATPQQLAGMRSGAVRGAALTSGRRWGYGGIAAAAAVSLAVLGVLQPWSDASTAAALTPPPLQFEFVDAHSLAIRGGRPAADRLLALSAAAAAQSAPERSGTVERVVTDSWDLSIYQGNNGSASAVIVPNLVETLVRADGSYTQNNRSGTPLRPDGRAPARLEPGVPAESTDTGPEGTIDTEAAAQLATDPATLREQLDRRADCGATPDTPARSRCQLRAISELYAFTVVPPKVEAALWASLALDANLIDIGETRDRIGRAGVGISLDLPQSGPARTILIIDPTTGRLLGREDLLLGGGQELGISTPAIVGFTAYVESGWTR